MVKKYDYYFGSTLLSAALQQSFLEVYNMSKKEKWRFEIVPECHSDKYRLFSFSQLPIEVKTRTARYLTEVFSYSKCLPLAEQASGDVIPMHNLPNSKAVPEWICDSDSAVVAWLFTMFIHFVYSSVEDGVEKTLEGFIARYTNKQLSLPTWIYAKGMDQSTLPLDHWRLFEGELNYSAKHHNITNDSSLEDLIFSQLKEKPDCLSQISN